MSLAVSKTIHDAIVVGAGHNGLVAAAYLARAGLDVVVLERRHMVGGAAATEEIFPGYKISTCSYLVHLLQEKIIRDLGLYGRGLRILPLDPFRFFPLPDGRSIRQWQDERRTMEEYSRFGKRDGEGYRKWNQFWARAAALTHQFFLSEPPGVDELRSRVRGSQDEEFLDRLINGTMTELLDECFDSDVSKASIVQTLDVKSFDGPSVLLAYATVRSASWMDPRSQGLAIGGMGSITRAMAEAARDFGASIRLGAEAKRILCNGGRAAGVLLADGQVVRGRMVISNADPKRTFLDLLEDGCCPPSLSQMVEGLDSECGTMKLHTIVDELPDFTRHLGNGFNPRDLVMTHICPSTEYYRRSVEDAAAGRVSTGPIMNIQIPTVYDSSIAPAGKHIVSMWIRYEPVHPTGTTWDELRAPEGERLIDLFDEYAPNYRRSILDWTLYTPLDIEQRLYMTDGNYHHLNHSAGQLLGDRLFPGGGYRTPVAGLYMCGAGTHPGGEVSGAPGHNAAHAILADLAAR